MHEFSRGLLLEDLEKFVCVRERGVEGGVCDGEREMLFVSLYYY